MDAVRIFGFATAGKGGNEEGRLKSLLERFEADIVPFDRQTKFRMFTQLLSVLRAGQYDLAVMEGSGVAGGFALILGKLLFGHRYVISSGDAIGPYLTARWPSLAPVFNGYEHLLIRIVVKTRIVSTGGLDESVPSHECRRGAARRS